ncbi:MAG: hypothetical protein JJU33_11075 [Phycisphaerales bacterium]|nr:hypothetical protein [Phycisphaerales bacterium]
MERVRASSRTIERRRAYGLALRRFMSGRLTNFEYEKAIDEIERRHGLDYAVWEIFIEVWPMYCDVREHRMTGGHRPDRETRRMVAERIVFLYSGRPFVADRSKATGGEREPGADEQAEPSRSDWIETTLFAIRWLGHGALLIMGSWVLAIVALYAAIARMQWDIAGVDEALRIEKTTMRVGWYGLLPNPWPFDSALDRERVLALPHECFGKGARG